VGMYTWNVAQVQNFNNMFRGATSFNADRIGVWQVHNAELMNG